MALNWRGEPNAFGAAFPGRVPASDQEKAAPTIPDLTKAIEDTAAQQSAQIEAGGDYAEAAAYTTASGLALSQADLERQSTRLQQYQTERGVVKTIGAQTAEVAAAGFKNSGSNLALLRNSVQQGNLETQVLGVQGEIGSLGYLSQSAAAQAEAAAASTAGDAATLLATEHGNAASLDLATSVNLMDEINKIAAQYGLDARSVTDQFKSSTGVIGFGNGGGSGGGGFVVRPGGEGTVV